MMQGAKYSRITLDGVMTSWKEAEFCQRKLQGGFGIWLVFYKEQGFAPLKKKKNLEKKRAEDEKPGRKEFRRNDFLIRNMKAFCDSFLTCTNLGLTMKLSVMLMKW